MKTMHSAEEEEHSWQDETNFQMENIQRQQQEATPTEKRFLKALHWMRCPKCGHALTTERYGSVAVDRCPDCRGVWLDMTTFKSVVAPESDLLRSCLRGLHRDRYT
jgi:predicted Zn-ribbon and HTH transcriptional regulator